MIWQLVGCSVSIATNVFGLCVRAGFGAQNCQPALHLIRSTKLQVCTSPRLTQNPCYAVGFLFRSVVSLSITATCSCLNGWTFYCPVATINTTVALQWFQSCFTFFAFVEIYTSVSRHNFSFFVSAVWTRQG